MKSKITLFKKPILTFLACCLFALSIHAQTSPAVVSTAPAHNATNVDVDALITVTFDQPIQAGITGKVLTLWYADTETVLHSYTISSLTISGNTLTLDRTLPYSTNLYISIESGFVKNASNQYNATYGYSSGWTFSTENDTYSPVLLAMNPLDGSINIYENSNILRYYFNEPIQAGSGNVIVKRVDNDAIALNVDVTNPSNVIVSGSTFTIVSSSSTFDYSTEYYVEFPSGVIEDLLGHPFAGIGAPPLADQSFTMRDAPVDTFPPLPTSYSPADNATGVDVNTDFTITFNENIQIGTGSFYVRRSSTGAIVYQIDVSNASITGSTATFTLPDNLYILTNYYIQIDAGAFTDFAGNDYAGTSTPFVWNFTTATASDYIAPTATALSPVDNATDVIISNNLTLNFNEAVQLVENAVLKNFGGSVIPSTSTVSGSTLTINPTSDLSLSTSYYVEIAYGAIRDLAGNSFAGFSGNTTWNFTTETAADTTPPTAVTFTPADNATNVTVSDNLTLLFNEAIQLTGNAVLKNIGGSVIPSTSTVSGSTLTINPTSDLANNTQYYVEIANGVIKDIAGNNYAGFSGNTTWNFTTEVAADVTPPTISNLSPLDNATGVAIDANLVITFNESIQTTNGTQIQIRNGNGTINEAFVLPNANVTTSGNTLTINPTSDFVNNSDYYVITSFSVVTDLAGNNFAGINDITTWNFTTVATTDVTPPTAVTFTPADNATNVTVSDNLTLLFNEAIQLNGNAVLKNIGGSVIPSTSTVSGSTLTINPTSDLANNTQYYVEIANGVIKDIAGNNYAGFSGNTTWNFTTETVADTTPPTAVTFTPADNATNVTVSDNLTLLFNEAIQLTGNAVLKNIGGSIIPSTSTVSGSTLTINPTSNLANNTQYYVEIANGVIKDIAGNNYAGFSGNTAWNFTTEVAPDTTPPTAVTFTPADNATNVTVSDNLALLFNEAIQLTGNAVLKNIGGSVIPSTSTVSGSTLTINPTSDLANNTQYYVEIANGVIKDIAGNNYAGFSGNTTWNFTTETAADTTPPTAVTFTPADNATNVTVSDNLTLLFNEAIQLTGNAVLKNIGGSVIPSTSTVTGSTLTINPTSNLANNTQYYVEIANGVIKDIAGNNYAGFSGNTTWNFTTETAFSIVSFSPADNATDVAIDQAFTITFNEPIQLVNTGLFQMFDANTDAQLGVNFFLPNMVSISGNSATITYPTGYISAGQSVYFVLSSATITNMSGVAWSGLSANDYTLHFVSADTTPPTAVTFTPADNATNVSVSDNLTLLFNEAIQLTGNAVLKNIGGSVIPSTSTVSGSTLTINPTSDLANNTQYYVEIANGVIMDIAGNNYAGFSGNSIWNFTTENTLSINDFESKQFISVFPNPTSELLNINFNNFDNEINLVLFDILGKKLFSKKITTTDYKINISHLPSGTYMLKIYSLSFSEVKQIIKL